MVKGEEGVVVKAQVARGNVAASECVSDILGTGVQLECVLNTRFERSHAGILAGISFCIDGRQSGTGSRERVRSPRSERRAISVKGRALSTVSGAKAKVRYGCQITQLKGEVPSRCQEGRS